MVEKIKYWHKRNFTLRKCKVRIYSDIRNGQFDYVVEYDLLKLGQVIYDKGGWAYKYIGKEYFVNVEWK